MADFTVWKRENLIKFAFESSQLIADREEEINHLKEDLKACINAYRELNLSIHEKEKTKT
jgi:hypothetical protein